MNRKEATELLPIIKAFSEGKIIEMSTINGWVNKDDLNSDLLISHPELFRIKPEPKYRPFKNADECWAEMQKHQPFGWVCRNSSGHYHHINNLFTSTISFQETEIAGSGNFEWSLSDLLKSYTFADGTPFGIIDEQ